MNEITANQKVNQTLATLSEYDDFLNFYIQIDHAASGVSWLKADLLSRMEDVLGDSSLRELSKELGENYSTLVSYVRVSRAFPADSRNEKGSFSLHFQASMADKYSGKNFSGEDRFKWLDEAVDGNLSTRSLARAIQEEKQEKVIYNDEPSEASVVSEKIRRGVATLVKMSDGGNVMALDVLRKLEELIKNYV